MLLLRCNKQRRQPYVSKPFMWAFDAGRLQIKASLYHLASVGTHVSVIAAIMKQWDADANLVKRFSVLFHRHD